MPRRFKQIVRVAHAPHQRKPLEERKQYWDMITKKSTVQPGIARFDANARWGSEASQWAGGQSWMEEENDNGRPSHALLPTTQLYALNALLPNQEGYP